MLNPSTADAEVDDPTIRRCIGYAKSWGFGELIVCNLFAYRATDPKDLKKCADPSGPENDNTIRMAMLEADTVICAWGMNGQKEGRKFIRRFSGPTYNLRYLELSKNKTPKHPLYLKKELIPQVFA